MCHPSANLRWLTKLGRPKGRVFSPVVGCWLLVAFAADARREFATVQRASGMSAVVDDRMQMC